MDIFDWKKTPILFQLDEAAEVTEEHWKFLLNRIEGRIKMEGIVKKVNSKGYGFITTNEIDFFFHHTEFMASWKELLKRFVSGEEIKVIFDNDITAPDGPRAVKVRPIEALSESSTQETKQVSEPEVLKHKK